MPNTPTNDTYLVLITVFIYVLNLLVPDCDSLVSLEVRDKNSGTYKNKNEPFKKKEKRNHNKKNEATHFGADFVQFFFQINDPDKLETF